MFHLLILNKKQTAKVKQQGKIGTCKNGDRVVVKGNNIKIEAPCCFTFAVCFLLVSGAVFFLLVNSTSM